MSPDTEQFSPPPPSPTAPLSPTSRTTPRRHSDRAEADRRELFEILDSALVCHLGVVVDGAPLVIPTAFGFDPSGPDPEGTLYVHGSVASRSLTESSDAEICVTATLVDGLVLARSAFNHSMNYRSAVIRGKGRLVETLDEKRRALAVIVEHVVPGRSLTLRPHTRKELAATSVVALPLFEASVKRRDGGPIDDEADVEAGVWAGVVPTQIVAADVLTATDATGLAIPSHVVRRRESLRPMR